MSGSGRSLIGLLVRSYKWRPDMEFLAPMATFGSGIANAFTSASNTQDQIQAQEQMQQQSEAFNASQAQINRDYQTQMSNTAYQRASTDMKAAGLNPMMMASGGMNASSPSGSTASIGTPSVPQPQRTSPFASLGQAAQNYVTTAVAQKTMDKMTDEMANLKTENAKIVADTALSGARKGLDVQATRTEEQETRKKAAEADTARSGSTVSAFEAAKAFSTMKLPQSVFDAVTQAGYVGSSTARAIQPLSDLVPFGRLFKDLWRDRVDRGY